MLPHIFARTVDATTRQLSIDAIAVGLDDICPPEPMTHYLDAVISINLATLPHVDKDATYTLLGTPQDEETKYQNEFASFCCPKLQVEVKYSAGMGVFFFSRVEHHQKRTNVKRGKYLNVAMYCPTRQAACIKCTTMRFDKSGKRGQTKKPVLIPVPQEQIEQSASIESDPTLLYCTCRRRFDPDDEVLGSMVECTSCLEWFHLQCVDLFEEDVEDGNVKWQCKVCLT